MEEINYMEIVCLTQVGGGLITKCRGFSTSNYAKEKRKINPANTLLCVHDVNDNGT